MATFTAVTTLTERKVWRRPPVPDPRRDFGRLTLEEQANVLRAMAVLRSRLGTWLAVAHLMVKELRAAFTDAN